MSRRRLSVPAAPEVGLLVSAPRMRVVGQVESNRVTYATQARRVAEVTRPISDRRRYQLKSAQTENRYRGYWAVARLSRHKTRWSPMKWPYVIISLVIIRLLIERAPRWSDQGSPPAL